MLWEADSSTITGARNVIVDRSVQQGSIIIRMLSAFAGVAEG